MMIIYASFIIILVTTKADLVLYVLDFTNTGQGLWSVLPKGTCI